MQRIPFSPPPPPPLSSPGLFANLCAEGREREREREREESRFPALRKGEKRQRIRDKKSPGKQQLLCHFSKPQSVGIRRILLFASSLRSFADLADTLSPHPPFLLLLLDNGKTLFSRPFGLSVSGTKERRREKKEEGVYMHFHSGQEVPGRRKRLFLTTLCFILFARECKS